MGRDGTLCVPNVFNFITEKEHDFQTDENIALLYLERKKKLNLSELTPQAAVMIIKGVAVKQQCIKTE